jgi:hypothetical protein
MLRYAKERIQADKTTLSVLYPDFKGGEYDFGVVVETFAKVKELAQKPPFTMRIPMRNKDTRLQGFNWLCEYSLELASKGTRLLMLVDEAQRVSNKNVNADGFELLQENAGMVGMDLVYTTHRPGDVHGSLRAASDRMIIFQTHHSRDIKTFQENIDVPDVAFKALKRGDYLEWHTDHGYRTVADGKVGTWQTFDMDAAQTDQK